jgi:hypothetical protein
LASYFSTTPNLEVDFTTSGIPGGEIFDQLVDNSLTGNVGISSGEVVGTPAPIVGTGLTDLVAGCGALLALGRRLVRKSQPSENRSRSTNVLARIASTFYFCIVTLNFCAA